MKNTKSYFIILLLHLAIQLPAQKVLIFEDFEKDNFNSRGWYDGFADKRTVAEFKNGSHSYAGNFSKGTTSPARGRRLFEPSEKVYISYWVKYSDNWIGSGVKYHPHEWSLLTTEDGMYQGPAFTYLTAYIEQVAGRPRLALQDSRNVDTNCVLLNNNSFVGCNGNFSTYVFTENRSVCACNGIMGYIDMKDCFPISGGIKSYYSARIWEADTVYFRNERGKYYKNDWHLIEAWFELNTISNGAGVPDGKIRYWYDGELLITSDNILFRTASHPNMKFNQLIYAPHIGVGSPINQIFWVDDLTISDGIPAHRNH